MDSYNDRNAFLHGLTTLPLIGGAVSLIGTPAAVATPATDAMMDAYSAWLFHERRLLCRERWPDEPFAFTAVPANTGADSFHFPAGLGWQQAPQPSTRAALVLSTVGCGWKAELIGTPAGRSGWRKNVIR